MIVSFYDANGLIVGTENGFTQPTTINPGNRAPFTVLISDNTVEQEAVTYDLNIDWRDSARQMFNERVLEGVPIGVGGSSSGAQEQQGIEQPEPEQEEESDDDDDESE